MTRITVLMSPGSSIPDDNPFVSLLVHDLPKDIEVRPFSWRRAFLTHYDVLHIHWPDHILRAGSPTRGVVKSVAFLALLARNRVLARHVRTVHNVTPHEGGAPLSRLALALWVKSCEASIYLSRAGAARAFGERVVNPVTIVHGDYAPFVDALERAPIDPVPGRLLAFGYLRPYKGIEQLVAAFRATDTSSGLSLRIVGPAFPKSYGETVRRLCEGDDRISVAIGRQRDAQLIDEISKASTIVLPYKQVYNSGAALLALTLNRPILVTESETMRELGVEVGGDWVRLVPDWNAEAISRGVSEDANPACRPNLDGRSWAQLSARYAEVYRELARAPRRRWRRARPLVDN
jgi:beta-1,4-mannosyltransferase